MIFRHSFLAFLAVFSFLKVTAAQLPSQVPLTSLDPIFNLLMPDRGLELKNYVQQYPEAVKAVDQFGATPLHQAAKVENGASLVKFLISKKADVNAKDLNGDRPLHYALKDPNFASISTVMQLLYGNARPLSKNKKGITPLHLAALNKKDRELELFLNQMPEPLADYIDAADEYGRTALMY